MDRPSPAWVDPDRADELSAAAAEASAEVLRGPLRYPSESGGWQLGDIDLSEHLARYRDQDLVVIIAATGSAKDGSVMCGICGFAMEQVGDCPRCRRIVADAARGLRRRHAEHRALMDEVDEILEEMEEDKP